jgi:mRNA interferase MazF
MALVARRFEVFLVGEIRKTRPCVVISPEEMNQHIRTVIVAPMTTKGQPYPSRVPCTFQGKKGHVVLDQIRTIDQVRLARRVGRLTPAQSKAVLAVLQAMFAE